MRRTKALPTAEGKNFMDNTARRVPVPLAELFDRLTIAQIKEVLDPKDRDSHSRELVELVKAIDAMILPTKRILDAYLIRVIVALAQVNLHIWYVKDVMQEDPQRFDAMMKLGHQLNGIRNQLKNLIAEEFDPATAAQKKTNVWTEDLHGWSMSIVRGRAAVDADRYRDATRARATGYEFLLTDLIDALTIVQIKETIFPDEKKAAYTAELGNISHDIKEAAAPTAPLLSGKMVRFIAFLAQANLHVWHSKDEMQEKEKQGRYYDLLRFAQDMNGLRNHVRNLLMDEFGENSPAKRKATFLDFTGTRWYRGILESLGVERNMDPAAAGR